MCDRFSIHTIFLCTFEFVCLLDFNLWMDIYPESEPFDMNLQLQKTHDEFMDKIGVKTKEEK